MKFLLSSQTKTFYCEIILVLLIFLKELAFLIFFHKFPSVIYYLQKTIWRKRWIISSQFFISCHYKVVIWAVEDFFFDFWTSIHLKFRTYTVWLVFWHVFLHLTANSCNLFGSCKDLRSLILTDALAESYLLILSLYVHLLLQDFWYIKMMIKTFFWFLKVLEY